MYLVTAEQMRQIDRKTIEELGIPEIVLMENAGKAIVDFLQEKFEHLQEKAVTILAGTGNICPLSPVDIAIPIWSS